jgi:hypothetical protein
MEIFGKVVDERGAPIQGASIQRYYPTGEIYSSVIASGSGGLFNGRVPDRNYFWTVSAPGYLTLPVSLENALHDRADLPIVVQLEPDPMIAAAVMPEPVNLRDETSPVIWIAGGIAIGAGALWIFGDNRTKVKIRKIFK